MRKALSLLFVVVISLTSVQGASAHHVKESTGRCPQYEKLAVSLGWKKAEIPELSRVMWRESRCQHSAVNQNKRKDGSVWSKDLGLMQINDYSWRRWLKAQGVITADSDLFTPSVNLKAALLIWKYGKNRHGNGWIAWKATSGK
jgi:hypothetical protein